MLVPEGASSISMMDSSPDSLGTLIEQGLAPRLNVIFDVDHTLIYAFDRYFASLMPGTTRDTHLLKLEDQRDT